MDPKVRTPAAIQAAHRAEETAMYFDSAHDLAQRISLIPPEQKPAAARTILARLRSALASSEAAAFWRSKGDQQ